MCGFSFGISKDKNLINEIKLMNKKIVHRGPDKEKFVNSDIFERRKEKRLINFSAGFRRLKIIDLSNKANQPMFYDNRYLIVFNGEIYNYIELKNILIKKNYKFKTKSDTEVILAAYDFWGNDCFNLFNGMWSIIIYDHLTNNLIACRDRYGVKPLYYRKIKDSLFFASEIKQLLVLNKENKINKKSLSNYLHHDLISFDENTFVENIYQVLPGHYIDFDFKKFRYKKKRWYRFRKQKFSNKNFENLLRKSINLRLRSDVKIGISLSGGIDSSTIASIIADIKGKSIKDIYTFSSRSFDKNDEYEYVKEFKKKYKFKNIPIHLKFENFKKDFLRIVKQHDYPISNLSIFSEWEVFKMMKSKKIKVNIDGHGADEQLCGYENYFSLYLLECLKNLNILLFLKFFKNVIFSNFKNKSVFIIKILFNLLPDRFLNLFKGLLNQKIKRKWIYLKYQKINKKNFHRNLVINKNFEQFFFSSLPKQLNWSDINSMSHSVETRSPFLDFNLVETILPSAMQNKISDIKSKKILRETFRSLIPTKIYNRNFKVGFLAPGEKWTRKNKRYIEYLFKKYFKYLSGIFDIDCQKKALKIIRGNSIYKDWIWKVIFLGAWIKHHNLKL